MKFFYILFILLFALSGVYALDSDLDGVADSIDFDDDNDGLLDYQEACGVVRIVDIKVSSKIPTSGVLPNIFDAVEEDSQIYFIANGQSIANKSILELDMVHPIALNAMEFSIFPKGMFAANTLVVVEGSNNNTLWELLGDTIRTKVDTGGVITSNGIVHNLVFSNTMLYRYYRIRGINGMMLDGPIRELYLRRSNCSVDVDGDGLPNRLDLDSDGDGCNDVIEAFSLDVNNDGRLDGDSISKRGKVLGSLSGYADLFPAVFDADAHSRCADMDKDGIIDIIDIDDDNDAILDKDESCLIVSKGQVSILSSGSINFVGNSFSLLDGRYNQEAFYFNVSNRFSNKAYSTFAFDPPESIDAIQMSITSNNIFGRGGKLIIQASNDNTNWINLSDTIVTGEQRRGLLKKDIPFAHNFVFDNTEKYNLYRIYIVEAHLTYWYLNEIDFRQSGCSLDVDGDGLSNEKDTDTDNDGCPDAVEGSLYVDAPLTPLVGGSNGGSLAHLAGGVNAEGVPLSISQGQASTEGVKVAAQLSLDRAPIDTILFDLNQKAVFSIKTLARQTHNYDSNNQPDFTNMAYSDTLTMYQWYLGHPDSGGVILSNNDVYTGVKTSRLKIEKIRAGLHNNMYYVKAKVKGDKCQDIIKGAKLILADIEAVPDSMDVRRGDSSISLLTNDLLNDVRIEADEIRISLIEIPDGMDMSVSNGRIYVADSAALGLQDVMYAICTQETPVVCDTTTARILVKSVEVGTSVKPITDIDVDALIESIPRFISPNGDGINDRFEITELLKVFPDTRLSVFNRWGYNVWNSKGAYKGDFDGRGNVSNRIRQSILPNGAYYYVLTFPKGKRVIGFIEIGK